MGGKAFPGLFEDIRFYGQEYGLVKYALTCDLAGGAPAGKPPFRERSTLVGETFVEPQFEEVRERNHVWENDHAWCVLGGSIHYGFTE